MKKTKAEKQLDAEIEKLYYQLAQGKQINIMDIGKVFRAGRDASANGTSVEEAIKGAIAQYCFN